VNPESVLVLTIGEVATRLNISRAEVERMIAAAVPRARVVAQVSEAAGFAGN
jgi:DNA-binding transcriptional regulator LsrR (DeoR family)